jgi:hypothetical protein
MNRGDGGNVMSGKVFQKRAIDRNGGLDRKRELPPIEQPKRLTAPLVFGRGRAIYSKGQWRSESFCCRKFKEERH